VWSDFVLSLKSVVASLCEVVERIWSRVDAFVIPNEPRCHSHSLLHQDTFSLFIEQYS
jgi:hypothetical protein